MDVETNRRSLPHPLLDSETTTGDVRIEMSSIVSTINLEIKNYFGTRISVIYGNKFVCYANFNFSGAKYYSNIQFLSTSMPLHGWLHMFME